MSMLDQLVEAKLVGSIRIHPNLIIRVRKTFLRSGMRWAVSLLVKQEAHCPLCVYIAA